MSDFWSNYWKQGHLNSFGDATNKNYKGVIESSWTQFFDQFKDKTNTLVDIGTGNGALIDIAINNANSSLCHFIGVDYAKLSVNENLKRPNIRFLENTNAENLPIEDHSVSAVISQFGIEYTDFSKSIPEVARVLTPEGKVRFVIHYTQSIIVKPNSEIHTVLKLLKGEDGLLAQLKSLLSTIDRKGLRSSEAEKSRTNLNTRLNGISNRNALLGTNFPAFLRAVVNPSLPYVKKQAMLDIFESEMNSQFERLDDLIRAAKSNEEISSLVNLLEANSIRAKSSQVIENGQVIGISVDGYKY